MRIIFLLILLAGIGVGIGYPWAVGNFPGRELGSWQVYDQGGQFQPVDIALKAADAPVRVLFDLTTQGAPALSPQKTILTITASTAGRTVLAQTLSFSESPARETSPQSSQRTYRDDAGLIADVEDGQYRFVVGPGDAEEIGMEAVDMVLLGGARSQDPRAQPLGFSLMAVGFIGLVLTLRRRRNDPPDNPNSQPPRPRWGRDASSAP